MSDSAIAELISELKQLKLRELQVLASLETILIHNTPVATNITPISPPFQVGDLVFITNKVRRPINRQVNNGDRTAVITKVSPNRIDIRTSNGSFTWRAPQNLQLQSQDE
jgi:hypothetical protein